MKWKPRDIIDSVRASRQQRQTQQAVEKELRQFRDDVKELKFIFPEDLFHKLENLLVLRGDFEGKRITRAESILVLQDMAKILPLLPDNVSALTQDQISHFRKFQVVLDLCLSSLEHNLQNQTAGPDEKEMHSQLRPVINKLSMLKRTDRDIVQNIGDYLAAHQHRPELPGEAETRDMGYRR